MPTVRHGGRACAHGNEDQACPLHGEGLFTSCREIEPGVFECAHLGVSLKGIGKPPARAKAKPKPAEEPAAPAAVVAEAEEPPTEAVAASAEDAPAAKPARKKAAAAKPRAKKAAAAPDA